MTLTYRGCKVQANTIATNTVAAPAQGKYRGASIAFRQGHQSSQKIATTKQYRGTTY